jgi:hypothetical protein
MHLLCICRFVVLVAGTMVYGRGDEESAKQELSEAVAEALVAEPTPTAAAAAVDETAPLLPPTIGISTTLPIAARGVPMPSEPIIVRGSFKSTMNIMSGSYSRSFTRSSLPRGSLVGSLAHHPHAPSRADSDSQA